jgi:hypothetical protein
MASPQAKPDFARGSAGERTRTSKGFRPTGPKPAASASSATPAIVKDRSHNSLTAAPHTFRVTDVRLPTLLVLLSLVAGCGYGDDDEKTAPRSAAPAQAVPRLPEPEAGGTLAVEDFNEFVEDARPAFATSALRMAIEFANAGEGTAATTSVLANEGPEGNSDEASVTVTRDGLADDSVHAIRYQIALERAKDGTWRLLSARRTQRCQPGRGHQDFSPQLCQ